MHITQKMKKRWGSGAFCSSTSLQKWKALGFGSIFLIHNAQKWNVNVNAGAWQSMAEHMSEGAFVPGGRTLIPEPMLNRAGGPTPHTEDQSSWTGERECEWKIKKTALAKRNGMCKGGNSRRSCNPLRGALDQKLYCVCVSVSVSVSVCVCVWLSSPGPGQISTTLP